MLMKSGRKACFRRAGNPFPADWRPVISRRMTCKQFPDDRLSVFSGLSFMSSMIIDTRRNISSGDNLKTSILLSNRLHVLRIIRYKGCSPYLPFMFSFSSWLSLFNIVEAFSHVPYVVKPLCQRELVLSRIFADYHLHVYEVGQYVSVHVI